MDPRKLPEEKIIKTLIYGVKSIGNQAERDPRETARLSAEEYPQVNQIVQNDIYALQRADKLELVLNRGGLTLKGITFTGGDPPSVLSTEDSSVNVAGMKCFPK